MTRAMDALVLSRSLSTTLWHGHAGASDRRGSWMKCDGTVEEMGAPQALRVWALPGRARRPILVPIPGWRICALYTGDQRERESGAVKPEFAPVRNYNSIDNIAEFFASRGKKFNLPKLPVEELSGKRGFRPGQKVKHPKYGEGTVYQREGDGEDAKITVQFPRFGLKKLVEKYAQLERA
jgi:hypothetical protein